jgi:[ribosomal protein S18]-alanine N-acetyltransferase
MTVVNVLPMTRQHISVLMRYEQAMFGPEAWTADGYRRELADKRHRYYIAAVGEDDSLLGWAGVRVVADAAEILTVGVVPHARGQGIGARLVEMLLDEARRRRFSRCGSTISSHSGSTSGRSSSGWASGAGTTTPAGWTQW